MDNLLLRSGLMGVIFLMGGIHSQRQLLMSKWFGGTNLQVVRQCETQFMSKVYNFRSETATRGNSVIGGIKLAGASHLRESKILNDDDLVPCSDSDRHSSNKSDDLT